MELPHSMQRNGRQKPALARRQGQQSVEVAIQQRRRSAGSMKARRRGAGLRRRGKAAATDLELQASAYMPAWCSEGAEERRCWRGLLLDPRNEEEDGALVPELGKQDSGGLRRSGRGPCNRGGVRLVPCSYGSCGLGVAGVLWDERDAGWTREDGSVRLPVGPGANGGEGAVATMDVPGTQRERQRGMRERLGMGERRDRGFGRGSPFLGSSRWRAAAPVGQAHRSSEVGGTAGWLGWSGSGTLRLVGWLRKSRRIWNERRR